MTDKEKYDFIDHVVHLTLSVEDRLLNEHGGDYSGLEEDGIDSNEYYRIITERVINILKKNNNYMQEEPVSDDLEKAARSYSNNIDNICGGIGEQTRNAFKAGANWQKNHNWKPADGDELPEIDREVIVLTQHYPLEGSEYAVYFAHRPNPDGWDGKSIATGEVEHYTPKTYDKCGWNIPDVKFWLDVELPKEIEL